MLQLDGVLTALLTAGIWCSLAVLSLMVAVFLFLNLVLVDVVLLYVFSTL